MGEAYGLNTWGAFHAGADLMIDQKAEADLKAELADAAPAADTDDDSDDDLLNSFGDDPELLRRIREARIAELSAPKPPAPRDHGSGLLLIDKGDWQREVVEASASAWVVVSVHDDSNAACDVVAVVLSEISTGHSAVKFVRIAAQHAMPASQFNLLPAIFCYRHGVLSTQIAARLIGPEFLDGDGAPIAAPALEAALRSRGVFPKIPGDDDDDDDEEEDDDFDDREEAGDAGTEDAGRA
ncbi:hypothetical protein M885DRAFT_613629 [Pelagophyceae sp. CCMP2097]|nr:hypothetical protein M885DRAFT_613629 [Pelagophyceae sp. CCMP2097]